MKTIKTHASKVLLLLTSLAVYGCSSGPAQLGSGQARVAILDENSREHLQADLTMTDYTAFAETVTNKMLNSKMVQNWGNKRPRLIIAALRNNTDNENIRVQDIYDRITETILNSQLARIMDRNATNFDYAIRTELSNTRQYGSRGAELSNFKIEFKVYSMDGEMIGQFSDVLNLGKSSQSWY